MGGDIIGKVVFDKGLENRRRLICYKGRRRNRCSACSTLSNGMTNNGAAGSPFTLLTADWVACLLAITTRAETCT